MELLHFYFCPTPHSHMTIPLDIIGDSVYSAHAELRQIKRQTSRILGCDRVNAGRVRRLVAWVPGRLRTSESTRSHLRGQSTPARCWWWSERDAAQLCLLALVHSGLPEDQPAASHARAAIRVESITSQLLDSSLPAGVLQRSLRALGQAPAARGARCRDERLGRGRGSQPSGRWHRTAPPTPTSWATQKEHYSGKKKTHTDKNILLTNEHTGKSRLFGADAVLQRRTTRRRWMRLRLPTARTPRSTKTPAFKAMSREGVSTTQPKKSPKAKS